MGGINKLFVCQCESTEHLMIVKHWKDEPEVFVSIHLSRFGFWKRLKNGLKYIFGHKSVYGDFEEFIFKPSDAGKLQEVVNILKQETYG